MKVKLIDEKLVYQSQRVKVFSTKVELPIFKC